MISNLISLKLINYSFSKNKLKCELLDNKPYIKIHNFTLSENEEVEINFKVSSIKENKINLYSKEYMESCSMANGLFKYSNDINCFNYKDIILENGLEEIAFVTQKKTKIKITQV